MTEASLIWNRAEGTTTFPLTPPGPLLIGRLPTCQIVLNDPKVSRSHARLDCVSGVWRVQDSGSQAGTELNGRRLAANESHELSDGDVLACGPIAMEFSMAGAHDATMVGGADDAKEAFERLLAGRNQDFGHEHLALLLDLSETLQRESSEQDMRAKLVEAVDQATRFANVAFVRRSNSTDGVEVLESVGEVTDRSGRLRMSRTMLRNARDGMVLVTDKGGAGDEAIVASLERVAVNQAFCMPVGEQGRFGFLYADNGTGRGDLGERERLKEAARVSNALVRMAASQFEKLAHGRDMVQLIADAVDRRDPCTGGHSRRVARLARVVAQAAGLDERMCTLVHDSGRVHDIGKISVPDRVLLKNGPGRLDESEFAEIRKHPQAGHDLLQAYPIMQAVLPGVLDHHEKWDGTGYPRRIKGEEISLLGRVLAVADVFDAITCKRPYRDAFPLQKARSIIEEGSGTHFDPAMVKAFMSIPESELRTYME
ncbi:MAG: FHA domain-containing protein [Planctomycetes bacterium]|nr:FHA domain-containing protein [Planctomycetota bacterium]